MNKLTAKEILYIIEANMSVSEFAYEDYQLPEDFTTNSDEEKKIELEYQINQYNYYNQLQVLFYCKIFYLFYDLQLSRLLFFSTQFVYFYNQILKLNYFHNFLSFHFFSPEPCFHKIDKQIYKKIYRLTFLVFV